MRIRIWRIHPSRRSWVPGIRLHQPANRRRTYVAIVAIPLGWRRVCVAFTLLALTPAQTEAQELRRKLGSVQRQPSASYTRAPLQTESNVDSLLLDRSSTGTYDPIVRKQLGLLLEDAQPYWDGDVQPDDIRATRATQKALTIHSVATLSQLLGQSELRYLLRRIKRSLNSLRSHVQYSVQSTGDSMTVSREQHGQKLLELRFSVDTKQGLDPQIQIGDTMRLRYDTSRKASLLEYRIDF